MIRPDYSTFGVVSLNTNDMKFRKKPVVIDAIQFLGHNVDEINAFVGENLKIHSEFENAYVLGEGPPVYSLVIPTLEGPHRAMPGDYIIRGVKGEHYPCKPDIFEMTYEPA